MLSNEEMVIRGEEQHRCSEAYFEHKRQEFVTFCSLQSLKELFKSAQESYASKTMLQDYFVGEYAKRANLEKPKNIMRDNNNDVFTVIYRCYIRDDNEVLFTRLISEEYGAAETFVYTSLNENEGIGISKVVRNRLIAGSFDAWDFDFIQLDFLKYLRVRQEDFKTCDEVSIKDYKRFVTINADRINEITVELLPDDKNKEGKVFVFKSFGDDSKFAVTVD